MSSSTCSNSRIARVLLLLAGSAPAAAQCPKTLLFGAGDPSSELFGGALDLSDEELIVGASGYDTSTGSPLYQGAAYVYHLGGAEPALGAVLLPSVHPNFGYFGQAVAIEGGLAAVTAKGRAFVFERTPKGWLEQALLEPGAELGDIGFGASLALSGDWLYVGAPGYDGAAHDSGAVYVYQRSGSVWSLAELLQAPDAGAKRRFGYSLACQADLLAVGSRGDVLSTSPYALALDAAYVFRRLGSAWNFEAALAPPAPPPPGGSFFFGESVSVDAERVLVGSPAHPTAPGLELGAAFLFEQQAGAWTFSSQVTNSSVALTTPASDAYAGFGQSVALRGGRALIGAWSTNAGGTYLSNGAAFLYELGASPWTLQTLVIHTPTQISGQTFGAAVDLRDSRAAVGKALEPFIIDPFGGDVTLFPADGSGCAPLTESAQIWSASLPEVQSFALDAGLDQAGRVHLLLGSFAGTYPGVAVGGLELPLVPDGLFAFMLGAPNGRPYSGSLGLLDAEGKASAQIQLPGGLGFLNQAVVHHAYVVLDPAAGWALTLASNAVSAKFQF